MFYTNHLNSTQLHRDTYHKLWAFMCISLYWDMIAAIVCPNFIFSNTLMDFLLLLDSFRFAAGYSKESFLYWPKVGRVKWSVKAVSVFRINVCFHWLYFGVKLFPNVLMFVNFLKQFHSLPVCNGIQFVCMCQEKTQNYILYCIVIRFITFEINSFDECLCQTSAFSTISICSETYLSQIKYILYVNETFRAKQITSQIILSPA